MVAGRAHVLLLVTVVSSYKLPDFSWDTLPVAWHSAVPAKELAAADLAVLRKYPLVTLEKTTGAETLHWDPAMLKWRVPITCQVGNDPSKCGCCQEDNFVRHAAQLKAANPRQHIVVYMNTEIAYPWYRSARTFLRSPTNWLRNSTGQLTHGTPGASWYDWDFTQPALGQMWMQMCLNVTRSGVVDGCFMDGCKQLPGALSPANRTLYLKNKEAWQEQLQREVPGLLVCGSGGTFVHGVAATQVQDWGGPGGNWSGYSYQLPMLFAAVAAGKVFEAHAACGSGLPSDPEEQTRVAAFLVAAGERSYYLCGGWETASGALTWPPLFDAPLGAPLGNATLSSDGVYTRHFARGTVAEFDTKTNSGRITWGQTKASPRGGSGSYA